jgi:hypothetical protein
MPVRPTRGGALVVSLDFELHWGVRDHVSPSDPYVANLLGERAAIDRMLASFAERGVACTWATVGFLFARNRAELERYRPLVRPRYADVRLDPYGEPVGNDHLDDPLHFASDVLAKIRATARQEVGTHTFSHFYCLEQGQGEEEFRSDLEAAMRIANDSGVSLRSIVFPRNQVNHRYARVLRDAGIVAYRGTQRGRMYTARSHDPRVWRGLRLVDAYVPIAGDHLLAWDEIRDGSGLACVRASFFLRPWWPRLRHLERIRELRLREAIRRAAREQKIVHLWWHPHNFGRDTDENLRMLERLLDEFDACRVGRGMESLTMAEVAGRVL